MGEKTSADAAGPDPHGFDVLTVSPLQDPALAGDLRARAATRLRPPDAPVEPIRDEADGFYGDHVLNPHLPPAQAVPPRAAAVLMAVAEVEGVPVVILTQRAAHLAAHPGQIALPGGKIEEGERPVDAALREAREEIALDPAAVEPLGAAEPYLTRTGFVVIPVVAVVRTEVRLRPDPSEVALIFTAPFRHVMTPGNYRKVDVERAGQTRTFHEIHSGPHRIWGVTAGILRLIEEKIFRP